MRPRAVPYIIVIALLAAVDYGALREIHNGTANRAFEYVILAISVVIVATLLSRLFARRR